MSGVSPRRFRLGQIAQNTLLGTLWQLIRIAGQALWVIVLARSLGPSGYGAFAGIAGLATTLGGLVGLGTGYLLLQNVSRNIASFGTFWRKTMLTTLFSGLLLVPVFTGIAHVFLRRYAAIEVIVAIGLSELVCYPMVYAAGFAFQAHERLGLSGLMAATMSGLRLLAIVAFWFTAPHRNLATYAGYHLLASLAGALYAVTMIHLLLRPARSSFRLDFREVREGLSFSTVWFTGNALSELDKTLALRFAGNEVAGIYSVAYRLVSALTVPVASLAQAVQPRLFRQAANPASESPRLVRRLALIALCYGAFVSCALWVLAGLLPWLLGPAFESAAKAARLLILVPPLFSLRLIGNAVLMTTGRQLMRVLIEIPGILLMIGLAALLMPRFGIAGIAMTVASTEATLTIAVWGLLWRSHNKRKPMEA